jgi:DNA-binding XRE family transcriptional regulator
MQGHITDGRKPMSQELKNALLRDHIRALPRTERQAEREKIATAAGVTIKAVEAWESGRNQVPLERCIPIAEVTSLPITGLYPALEAAMRAAADALEDA